MSTRKRWPSAPSFPATRRASRCYTHWSVIRSNADPAANRGIDLTEFHCSDSRAWSATLWVTRRLLAAAEPLHRMILEVPAGRFELHLRVTS